MTYEEAQKFIADTNRLGSRPGLEAIRELLKRLGSPQDQCRVVHIAGTNGKGSVFAFVSSILQEQGYRVGRYISPTIFTYLERFQINGTYMDKETFANLVQQVQEVCEKMVQEGLPHPTSFEVETAIAFLYFLQEKVDLVLLETGMGGRQDATNVVKKPLATVFASISRDHMAFLGDTLAKIAQEKAGIMREAVPCVIAPMQREAAEVLCEQASRHHALYTVVDPKEITKVSQDLSGSTFCYQGESYHIALLGTFQVYNAVTALQTCRVISSYFYISREAIAAGLAHCRWPGRMEVIGQEPLTIRDGAHNIDAIRQLKKTLQCYFPQKKMRFVIGILKDKEHREMVKEIAPLAQSIATVTPPDPRRALHADVLAREIQEVLKSEDHTIPVCPFLDVNAAVKQARKECEPDGVVVIFGSLSFLGQIKM